MNDQPNAPIVPAVSEPVYQNWIRALTRPNEQTYAVMAASPNARATTGYLWYFIGSVVVSIISTLVNAPMMQTLLPEAAGQPGFTNTLLAVLCGAPIGAAISTLIFAIGAAIMQWIAGLFGGRGTNDKLAYVLSNILTPYLLIVGLLMLFAAIPYVGVLVGALGFFAWLYTIVLAVMAVKGVNQFGWGAAIGTVLIPLAVLIGICVCIFILAGALLMPVFQEIFPQIQQSLPQ
jgi:hypothetical protein